MKTKHIKVLKFVNRTRKALGYKPLSRLPKGETYSVDYCPLARALKSEDVGDLYITIPSAKAEEVKKIFRTSIYSNFEDLTEIRTPRILADFIKKFDRGNYPELIIRTDN